LIHELINSSEGTGNGQHYGLHHASLSTSVTVSLSNCSVQSQRTEKTHV